MTVMSKLERLRVSTVEANFKVLHLELHGKRFSTIRSPLAFPLAGFAPPSGSPLGRYARECRKEKSTNLFSYSRSCEHDACAALEHEQSLNADHEPITRDQIHPELELELDWRPLYSQTSSRFLDSKTSCRCRGLHC